MKSKGMIPAAILVAALGGFVPGCFLYPPADPTLGKFCASPAEGSEYCVSAKHGPGGAWEKAKANGNLPIAMWAEWPDTVDLDTLVRSRSQLDAWLGDIDRVVDYLKNDVQSAESYQASMDGKLGQLLKMATSRQRMLLAEEPVDVIGDFKSALGEKASEEKESLVAELASDKQSIGVVQGALVALSYDATALGEAYADLVAEFSTYRTTEEAETKGYEKLAEAASTTTLENVASVEQSIMNAAKEASAKPNDFVLHALKLAAEIQQFELLSGESIAPHESFMFEHGASMPDMTSSAQRSINAMLGYVDRRVRRSDSTATALVMGLVLRRQALALLDAGPTARENAMEARAARASEAFQGETSTLVEQLDAANTVNEKLGLPYLAKRYQTLKTLLQLQPLCVAGISSFREAACKPLRDRFKAMATEAQTTLPAQISTGITTMRTKGIDAALLDAAKEKLDAGDVKGAAMMYDAALRSAEGT